MPAAKPLPYEYIRILDSSNSAPLASISDTKAKPSEAAATQKMVIRHILNISPPRCHTCSITLDAAASCKHRHNIPLDDKPVWNHGGLSSAPPVHYTAVYRSCIDQRLQYPSTCSLAPSQPSTPAPPWLQTAQKSQQPVPSQAPCLPACARAVCAAQLPLLAAVVAAAVAAAVGAVAGQVPAAVAAEVGVATDLKSSETLEVMLGHRECPSDVVAEAENAFPECHAAAARHLAEGVDAERHVELQPPATLSPVADALVQLPH